MALIVWSERVLKDINEIAEYISRDSFQYAQSQTKLFFERASELENYPLLGRPVPELKDNKIRQILCGHYRIIYEIISESKIGILTIHHQSRLLKNNPAIKKIRKKK